ncbi:urease accessory protein UreF [Frigidibacter sp. ROC022]|uniref:urease accessory protein UreF n=1 Tax=Frigidibacter sp. ROC022 TaxID=2971796 RepID=UPI00215A2593|nr:urease accessory UreF family protein [Frigidibacter sp. ROC022]MCR8723963.1 urease accessory protein UreF [Frigidibacter sp. ROC022]
MTRPVSDPGLTLSQLFSPAFPVGSFAYSHGLEAAIADGRIGTAAELQAWLRDVLAHGAGRNDALLLAAAHAAAGPDDLARVDALSRALVPSSERLRETVLQGAAFARTVADVWGIDLKPLSYPVAAGRAARLLGLPPEATARHYLLAMASTLVSVAVRLVPLGQTEGQQVLAALVPLCAALAAETADGDLDEIGGAAILSDLAGMRHETMETRVFRS